MNNKKEQQTIQQYALSKSNHTIHSFERNLKELLKTLKNLGFPCNKHDVFTDVMRKKLSEFEAESKAKAQAQVKQDKAQAKQTEAAKLKEIKKIALIKQVKIKEQTKADVIKIGQLINLCFELIPVTIADKIRADCQKQVFGKLSIDSNKQALSDIFVSVQDKRKWKLIEYFEEYGIEISANISVPIWAISDHNIGSFYFYDKRSKHLKRTLQVGNNHRSFPFNISGLEIDIKNQNKNNSYTDALVQIFYFLFNLDWLSLLDHIDFKRFFFIGELLIDMGAIDSALTLYVIDERIYSSPNILGLLATNAVKTGDLQHANKLIVKLIENEPYHPLIPALQAEIKRLEQRHRLKATFSIDFSKLDELSGVEFENLLMDKFAAMGFKIESTPTTGDFGADLIVENNEGSRIIVQCKRFKSKVNLKSVQEVVGAIGHYAGDMGIVITNNSFLNSAVKLAESHDIELWDGDKLVSFLAGDLSFSQIFP